MYRFLTRLFIWTTKAEFEAINKWAYQYSREELEAESLKHKIQTLQRLPRYKQTTPDYAQKLAQLKHNLREVEGDAIFTSFVRKFRRDFLQKEREMTLDERIASWGRIDKAKQAHANWQRERFRSNWSTFPDWHTRMFLLRKRFRNVKGHLALRAHITRTRLPHKIMLAFLLLKYLLK